MFSRKNSTPTGQWVRYETISATPATPPVDSPAAFSRVRPTAMKLEPISRAWTSSIGVWRAAEAGVLMAA
jgi:hypothetical protein